MASLATTADPPKDTKPGTHIMVAGIVFQMASITVFAVLFGLFVVRSRSSNLPRKNYFLLGATAFSTVTIYIRSIYRTIELAEGWTGYLITREPYFIVLDGIMIVLATGVFNVIHPGWFGLNKVPFNSYATTTEGVNKPSSPPMEETTGVVEGNSG
ncbi:hypothetical protein PISL3812_04056 [Talaromyces islandicus]|uniref:RTA1 domain protein n=1 Tax=Talaromyces islandicus TaxID=28573 RepID=A0A0U1LVB0_TALIS|nr:hypothetical protein PISL3812_04056 [Talaromyces islandicus]